MEKLRLKEKSIKKYLSSGGSINTLAGILGVTDIRTIGKYITDHSIVLTCESVLNEIQRVLKVSRIEILEEEFPKGLNKPKK